MKGFAGWLHDYDFNDPGLVALKAFATAQGATWPYWSNNLEDYLALIRNAAAAADQPALINTLRNYFSRWTCEQVSPGFFGTIGNAITGNLGKLALVGFGIIFAWILKSGFTGEFFTSLANTEQVRGLVTFFFVLATTGIIVLFSLGIFWLETNDDVTKRLAAAKDLLTIVIGVLGTIMGFYFGSATGEAAKMSISALSPPVVHVGETPTITGHISGGTKPYKYTVAFSDPNKALTDEQLKNLKFEGTSTDGTVTIKMTPPPVTGPVTVNYELSATDDKSAKASSSGTFYLEPKKAP